MNKTIAMLAITSVVYGFATDAKVDARPNDQFMVSKNIMVTVDSFQDRIKRLEMEIGKGESIYTHEELQAMVDKLKETNGDLRDLMKAGK